MLRIRFLVAACAATLATPAWGVDLPIVSIEIGPDGALVERAGRMPAGDDRVVDLPLAIEAGRLELAIAGLDTPPAPRLEVVEPLPAPPPEAAWRARYAAAQATFAAAQPAIERADLRAALARSMLERWGAGELGSTDLAPAAPSDQDALHAFLVANLERAIAERTAARRARETAREELLAMDRERAAADPVRLPRAQLVIPEAAGRELRLRYRVADAAWSPRYRLEVAGGDARLVREALVAVPYGYEWRPRQLVLRTRRAATDAWLEPLQVPVLGLGGSRELAVGRFGGSRRSESAVATQFTGFARQQNEDGSYGDGPHRLAATALTTLAVLGAGYDHRTPNRFRRIQQRAIAFLGERAVAVDELATAALCTTALCEAYAMTGDQELKPVAERALEHLGNLAFGATGLEQAIYREGPLLGPEILTWTVMAFKSAKAGGLDTGAALERCAGLLPQLEGHAQRQEAAVARTLAALYLGHRAGDPIFAQVPVHEWVDSHQAWLRDGRLELVYFATLACFQLGGEHWQAWNRAVRDRLVEALQRGEASGSYQAVAPTPLGDVAAAALLTLPLECYYRYLPVAAGGGAQGAEVAVAQEVELRPYLDGIDFREVQTAARGWPLRYELGPADLDPGARQVVAIDALPLPGGVALYAVPAVRPGAWRRLETANPLAVPLIAGPMAVVVAGEPLAERELPFTPPGEAVVVPLGREDRVRVVREERRASEDAWGKRREEVRLRYRVAGLVEGVAAIRIDEPMPRPSDAAIRLRSLVPALDLDALDRRLVEDPVWHLDLVLAAAGTEGEIVYELRHPLSQRPVVEVER